MLLKCPIPDRSKIPDDLLYTGTSFLDFMIYHYAPPSFYSLLYGQSTLDSTYAPSTVVLFLGLPLPAPTHQTRKIRRSHHNLIAGNALFLMMAVLMIAASILLLQLCPSAASMVSE